MAASGNIVMMEIMTAEVLDSFKFLDKPQIFRELYLFCMVFCLNSLGG